MNTSICVNPQIAEAVALELAALTAKIDNLTKFNLSEMYFKLPTIHRQLLDQQLYPMTEYQRILKQRLAVLSGWHPTGNNYEVPEPVNTGGGTILSVTDTLS